jgi:hypothetical protein
VACFYVENKVNAQENRADLQNKLPVLVFLRCNKERAKMYKILYLSCTGFTKHNAQSQQVFFQ